MRRCILHFGMHKTGSSSIQESLHGATHLSGAHYVDLGHANASGALQAAFADGAEGKAQRRLGRGAEQLARKRQRTLSALSKNFKANASTFVISAESLCNFRAHELQRLVEALLTHVDRVEAVGYIRDARSYMESAFQQHVRAGQPRKWQPSALYPNYREKFEKFELILGSDQVQFWPFDPAAFSGKDVVLDFCDRLGIGIDPSAVCRVNEGLSRGAVSLLYVFRTFGLPHLGSREEIAVNKALLSVLSAVAGPRTRFSPELIAPVLAAQREDLAWMEGRLGTSVSGLGVTDGADITCEADLLRPGPVAVAWLADQLGASAQRDGDKEPSAQVLARWMFQLWTRLNAVSADGIGPGLSAVDGADWERQLEEARRLRLQARRALHDANHSPPAEG